MLNNNDKLCFIFCLFIFLILIVIFGMTIKGVTGHCRKIRLDQMKSYAFRIFKVFCIFSAFRGKNNQASRNT